MTVWIEEVLATHVLPTGFLQPSNMAVGRFWGTQADLNTLLAQAEGDRAYLKGWGYRISCTDGDADLKYARGRFYVKESTAPAFLRVLRPEGVNNLVAFVR